MSRYDPNYRPLHRPGEQATSMLWHNILSDDTFERFALEAIESDQDTTAEQCERNWKQFALENL